MNKARRVLDVAGFVQENDWPETVKQAADRLGVLAGAIDTLGGGSGSIMPSLKPDWKILLDLWTHADMRLGRPEMLVAKDNMPEADPISMIDAGRRYRVIAPDKAERLKTEFMAKASAAAGVDLTEAQVRKLHRLFLNNNPFSSMKVK